MSTQVVMTLAEPVKPIAELTDEEVLALQLNHVVAVMVRQKW